MRVPRLLPALLVLLPLLCGCAAGRALDGALAASADAEIARLPDVYSHGQARAWVVRRGGRVRGLLWGTLHVAYGGDTVLPRAIRGRFYGAADLTVELLPGTTLVRAHEAIDGADSAVDPRALLSLDAGTRAALDHSVPFGERTRLSLRGLAMLVTADAAARLADAPDTAPQEGFVDLDLIDFARAQGRPVRGLEQPQLSDPTVLDPNGPDAAALLRLALRRAPTQRAMGDWAEDAYGRGEVARTVAILFAWQADAANLRRNDGERAALLDRRNAVWLPELARIFERPGEHFVAVGAAHLLGRAGLVAGLRRLGFGVVPCPGDACP